MRQNRPYPPQGALAQPDGSVVWRVWAPLSAAVSLVTLPSGERQEAAMTPEGRGYFAHRQSQVEEGLRYAFKLADGRDYPDPASRWQPNGVHRPSAIFFPESHRWSDTAWRGIAREELVIYELHVGAFTPEGMLEAIIPRLPQLLSLGVTAIELMPVAQFAGDRNWGYDAVYPYAVQNSYGGPRALQQFVDAAHQAGLAVILDVVYNHLGPEGNYLGNFGPYFTDRYHTPWGMTVNYDGPESDPVRQFVVDNAAMWIRDFHVDGLRLDAVHAIYDLSPRHILADIQVAVQREATRAGRLVHVIAESNQNDVRLICPKDRGGYGLDGVWNDDFHHSIHALLTGERDGYYVDFGEPAHLAKALNDVFVYDGRYSPFRRRRHGSRVGRIDRTRFVVCVQNHDQVGNRAQGDRLSTIVAPAAQRLACGLLLLSPYVPLLFMGEEYGETRPFPFFCSFDDPVVVEAVRRGRREEFAALKFRWGSEIPDPQAGETFAAAKLDWVWPEGSSHSQRRQLYQDLLAARRRWPALRDRRHTNARLLNDASSTDRDNRPTLLLLQRGGDDGLLAVANLTMETLPIKAPELNGRKVLLSTEDALYGGSRELLPSPFGRGAGGDGIGREECEKSQGPLRSSRASRPHPNPLPKGEGTWEKILPHELLVFDGSGGQP
jgi:maltooligosyltrehalose trehalohydrolase